MRSRWHFTPGNVFFVWLGGVLLGVGIVLLFREWVENSLSWKPFAFVVFAVANTLLAILSGRDLAGTGKKGMGASGAAGNSVVISETAPPEKSA